MENYILFASQEELEPRRTFECGQCFRWNADESGLWRGAAGGRAAALRAGEGGVYIDCEPDDLPFWRVYFDMDSDYAAASAGFGTNDYLRACVEFGRGIRLLRQDPWEALCSFIISQCNNIPRIKGIVEALCRLRGERFTFRGETVCAFPTAESLAELQPEDLAPLRAGYRAPYIIGAARAVASGELDLAATAELDYPAAEKTLMGLRGVGRKVADCAVLFGLHKTEAFPVDVWMKRALREHFPPDFDPATAGEWAGLLQQYVFFYERSGPVSVRSAGTLGIDRKPALD